MELNNQASFIIIGTGGFAVELSSLIRDAGLNITGFIGPTHGDNLKEDWLGDDDCLDKMKSDQYFLIAIGEPLRREELFIKLEKMILEIGIFIHKSSYISNSSSIETGSIIYPGSSIHANVTLEKGVLVNSNSTIGHETTIVLLKNIEGKANFSVL